MDVVDAEGLDLEPVGEDKTCVCGRGGEGGGTRWKSAQNDLFSPYNILSHVECA